MEWTIVTVIITMFGFGVAVMTPLIKLNTNIAKLTFTMANVDEKLKSLDDRNSKSHDRIWKEFEDTGAVLENHETRITKLEAR
ncbi:hypothetical protein LJB77_03255 [Ruminococcaceae bacterium OttesenSCG-928-N02]|nr:hypothetical protein [Ruminococcaceae bacterium OttesenSCG-928-N02]